MANDPLHDAEVVHHLNECDEEDDGRKDPDEKPMLVPSCLVEEEGTASLGLPKEVASKGGNPLEDGKASTGLEDKESDDLLEEQTNDNGGPLIHQLNTQCSRLQR